MSIRTDEPRARDVARTRSGLGRVALTVVMIIVLAYFVLPLFWVTLASTKSNTDLFTTFGLWFGESFELVSNVGQLFARDQGIFFNWMGNSLLYAGASALAAAFVSAAAGYVLAKFRFRGRGAILAIIVGSIMIPAQALVLPTFFLLNQVGLTGTALSVILPMSISPIGVFIILTFANEAIPDELLEAARIDGAGELGSFFSLGLRLLSPGIATVFVLTFVANWNNFFLPLVMLNDDRLYPVTVGISNWNAIAVAGLGFPQSLVVTGALLSILPVAAVFLATQKYWKRGLTAGTSK
ncbi:carbohydrate ABC transporter permease [Microbacterium sp.]|uniref:carbohydrate ABC transporter permease n=1 Tax=Microbacterium sp. TaxID=51671 RepID=UPI003F9C1631